jgi:hypothetical protein
MGVITNANILRIKRFRITNYGDARTAIFALAVSITLTNSLYTLRQRNTPRRQNIRESSLFTTTTFSPLINIVK